jgi:hypothetical protein
MTHARIVRHVFRLAAIAERRRAGISTSAVLFVLEIAPTRTDARPYLRRAVRMLRTANVKGSEV